MSSLLARKRTTILALSLALIAFYLPPTTHQLRVFGILSRPSDALGNTHAHAYRQGESTAEVKLVPGTTYCEDLHLHERSGLLVTACEGEQQDRRGWFPPLGVFDRPPVRGGPRGSIVVVDPQVRSLPSPFSSPLYPPVNPSFLRSDTNDHGACSLAG
jgi:hypothetical protein